MIYPTIHLNGTTGQSLMDSLFNAIDALDIAGGKMREAGPNGRDYPNGGLEQATEEHRARVRKLLEVASELEEIALNISNQCDSRKSK